MPLNIPSWNNIWKLFIKPTLYFILRPYTNIACFEEQFSGSTEKKALVLNQALTEIEREWRKECMSSKESSKYLVAIVWNTQQFALGILDWCFQRVYRDGAPQNHLNTWKCNGIVPEGNSPAGPCVYGNLPFRYVAPVISTVDAVLVCADGESRPFNFILLVHSLGCLGVFSRPTTCSFCLYFWWVAATRVLLLHCSNVKVNFCDDHGGENVTANGNIYLQEEDPAAVTMAGSDDNLAITAQPFIVHIPFRVAP